MSDQAQRWINWICLVGGLGLVAVLMGLLGQWMEQREDERLEATRRRKSEGK